MIKSKKIAILAIIAMVLCMLPAQMFAAASDANAESLRLAGLDRIETALAVSHAGWDYADTVILAPSNQNNLVDALAAAPLAGQVDGPILLTPVNQLDPNVKARIRALQAKTVYVVGAISDAVAEEVDAMTNVTAIALKGNTRVETAAKINELLTYPQGSFVVGYNAIPDALSVASYAAKNRYAIIVTEQNGSIPAGQQLVGTKFYTIGGPSLVADVAGATRIYGADRFETNLKVAETFDFDYRRVYVANGFNNHLCDALAVAPLAAQYGSFVALADNINNEVKAASFVNTKVTGATKVIAVGGIYALSDILKAKVGIDKVVVEYAEAVNLKQIKVVFNKEVNKTSAETVSKYKLDDVVLSNGIDAIAELKVELQSDKKTVIITLDNDQQLENGKTHKFQIGSIIDGTGVESDVFNTTIKYTDTTVPYITEVKVLESKKLRVIFNEPVYNNQATTTTAQRATIPTSLFEVEGGVHPVVTATANLSKCAVDLVISTPLQQGQHEVKVKSPGNDSLVDFAGYRPVTHTKIFTMTNDTTAPTVTVKSADETEVVLLFSEPVKNVDKRNVRYRHTYDQAIHATGTATGTTEYDNQITGDKAASVVSGTDDQEWIIHFGRDKVLPLGTVNFYIGYVQSSGDKIEDKFGNVLPATTLTLNVVQDTQAPQVKSVVFVDTNTIDVEFDESVIGGDIPTNYTLKDSSGDKVNVTGAVSINNSKTKFRLTTADMKGGTYYLTIGNIKDDSLKQNMMPSTTKEFNTSDNVRPEISRVIVYDNNTKIRVYFNEYMLDDGLTVKENYSYQLGAGPVTPLPAGTVVNKIDNKTVEIVLKNGIVLNGHTLYVSGALKDRAGNRLTSSIWTTKTISAADAVAYVDDSAKATAPNKVEFKLDRMISVAPVEAFTLTGNLNIGGTKPNPKSVAIVNDPLSGKSTITLTLDGDVADTSFKSAGTISIAVPVDPAKKLKTELGITIDTPLNSFVDATSATAAKKIKDYARPYLVSNKVITEDSDSNGQIDGLLLTYSEPINTASVQESDFTVDTHNIIGVQAGLPDGGVDGNRIRIKLQESGAKDTGVTPKVTQIGQITDDSAQRNALDSSAAVTAKDNLAPQFASAVLNAAKNLLTITFSEDVTASNVAGTFTALTKTDGTELILPVLPGLTYGDVTHTAAAKNVVTVKIIAGGETIPGTATVGVAANKVYDMAGTAMAAANVVVTGSDATAPALLKAVTAQTNATNVMLDTTNKQFTVTMKDAYAGAFGNSIKVVVGNADLGAAPAAKATAAFAVDTLTITVNNNAANLGTVQDIINAVNAVPGFSAAVSGNGALITPLAGTETEADDVTPTGGGKDVVTFTFSEGIKDITPGGNVNNFFEFTSGTAITVTGTADNTATPNDIVKTATIDKADKQIKGATVNVKAGALTDPAGNAATIDLVGVQ